MKGRNALWVCNRMTDSNPSELGAKLYRIVEAYADLGIHRTGTAVDRITADWFKSQLEALGGRITRHDYQFDFFDAVATVKIDGDEIESMPLYYEAIGNVKTTKVAVAEFGDGEHGSGLDNSLEALIDSAMADGYEALVIATLGGSGELVALNCVPELRNRIPVLLVPGRFASALKRGEVSVEYSAEIVPGTSTNIIGEWGNSSAEPPFVLTTPMSGWFTCAGERGTGIAMTLFVAEQLLKKMPHIPLKVIALSGHEIGFIGAYRLTETVTTPPRAVFHLGSCLAASDAHRIGIVHTTEPKLDGIREALAPLQISPNPPENHLDPACWVGESQCWAEFGMPMLSVAGLSPLFHTPEDVAEKATTPELLESAAKCYIEAALALIQN